MLINILPNPIAKNVELRDSLWTDMTLHTCDLYTTESKAKISIA